MVLVDEATKVGSKQTIAPPQRKQGLSALLAQLRYELRTRLSGHPSIFLPLARWKLRRSGRQNIVNADSEILICGFPRSGNSFAQSAFTFAQSRPVSIAHHLHVPAQVIEAVRLKVPALVLVRRPADAVVAFKLMNPTLRMSQILRSYVHYHRYLLPYMDRFVVATFEQVTSDFGAVTARINAMYGTDFREFAHSEENVATVFAEMVESGMARLPGRKVVGTVPQREPMREARRQELRVEYARLQAGRTGQQADYVYSLYLKHSQSRS